MSPVPPPLNAVPHLNEEQRRELGNISATNRLLGAWLILIRDDSLGEWEERLLPCAECVHHRLPCIDYSRAEPSSRCEGYCRNHQQCSQSYVSAQEVSPPDQHTSKKRKLESTEAGDYRDQSVIASKQDIDITFQSDDLLSLGENSTSSEPYGAAVIGVSKSSQPSRVATPPLPPKPIAPLGTARGSQSQPSYSVKGVQAILDKALRHSHFNVKATVNKGVDLTDFQRFEYSVIVRSPTSLSTWLVAFVDHTSHKGRVFFDDQEGTVGSSRVGGRCPTRVSLERAFDIFHRRVTLEAELHSCMSESSGGSFHATALAAEFILNGPGIPGRELVVDKKEAMERHGMLLADELRPSVAVRAGKQSKVVA